MILPMAADTYLEIVEVLDHPASDKAPFGQAVRARSALGGGWLGWVVAVDDIAVVEQRLGRQSVAGNRHRPDRTELLWRQIGVNGLIGDPQLPFFVQWQSPPELHPSAGADGRWSLACLEIAGDPRRVSEWLGETVEAPLEDVKVDWVAPHGTPASSRPRCRRPRASSGSEPRPRPRRRGGAEPEHLAPPRDVRGREPRLRPRRPRGVRDGGRGVVGGPAAARPGLRQRLPPAAVGRDRPLGGRRRAAPRPGAPRATPVRGLPRVDVRHGAAQDLPLPDASVDVVHVRWAYFFGPGCEPGLRELDRVVRRGGTAFVVDNDATRSTWGRWFARGYPGIDPVAVERFLGRARLAPRAGDHGWSFGSRADLEAVVRIELDRPTADAVLAEHPPAAGLDVDYAVNVFWRTF